MNSIIRLAVASSFLWTDARAGTAWAPLGPQLCDDERYTVEDGQLFTSNSQFGYSVKAIETSSNAFVMAIGSPGYTSSFLNQGKVQLYKFDEGACLWRKEVSPVLGEATEDRVGDAIALSCDANTIAIAGDLESGDGDEARTGFVQVYQRNKNGWSKKGQELRDGLGDVEGLPRERSFGYDVQLNCDGNLLYIAAQGYMQVFTFQGNEWQGSRILWDREQDGEYSYPMFSVAKASSRFAQRKFDASVVQVFDLQGDAVNQIGVNITEAKIIDDQEPVPFQLVREQVLSRDGETIAIAFDTSFSGDGFAVYNFVAGAWLQVGNAVQTGPVSWMDMNSDGTQVAVLTSNSRLQVYALQPNSQWERIGQRIFTSGTELIDLLGDGSVVVTDDTNTNGVQAYFWPEAGRIDCYPDFQAPEANTCERPEVEDEEEPEVVVQVEGDKDISGGGAAALAIACVAFVGLLVLMFLIWAGKMSLPKLGKRKPNQSTVEASPESEKMIPAPIPQDEPMTSGPYRGPVDIDEAVAYDNTMNEDDDEVVYNAGKVSDV